MKFLRYLEDKRRFIALQLTLMSFDALMMITSANSRYDAGDLIYTLAGFALLTVIYLIFGYFAHRSHCRTLHEMINSKADDASAMLPQPRNEEQRLYSKIIKKMHRQHMEKTEQIYNEKMEFQDYIISWVHEVKSPITACILLIQQSAGKTVEEVTDKIEDEIQRIDHYVEQALYYSRIDAFSKDYFISEVSANQIVRSSVKKHAKQFIAKRIRFAMPEEEQRVHSDAKWLGFIIDQIMANALKYTDNHGMITCSFEEDKEEKRLCIRDSGIGVHPEDIGRLFEKGFTGSTGRQEKKSTGMGLYLADQMAAKLGHRLSVRSEQGKYTEVIIHFPKSTQLFHF